MSKPATVKSPLTMDFIEKFHSLPQKRAVNLMKESYDPRLFGTALAFKISVGDLFVEVSTQDPAVPFEIDLRRADFRAWARASHLRSFFLHQDDPQWSVPDAQLPGWFFANFEEVYALLCEPIFADRLSTFRAFSRSLDANRQPETPEYFNKNRGTAN
jgi:hypothetical protein